MSFGATRRLVYHFVINPKYRRAVLVGEVAEYIDAAVRKTCAVKGYSIIALAVQPDHVHLLLDLPTTAAPAKVMQDIKWFSAARARQRWPEMRQQKAFWSRRYFVRLVGSAGDTKTVESYIKKQEWKK